MAVDEALQFGPRRMAKTIRLDQPAREAQAMTACAKCWRPGRACCAIHIAQVRTSQARTHHNSLWFFPSRMTEADHASELQSHMRMICPIVMEQNTRA
jgi:hypothetical protein